MRTKSIILQMLEPLDAQSNKKTQTHTNKNTQNDGKMKPQNTRTTTKNPHYN